jgi:hypothetical protein
MNYSTVTKSLATAAVTASLLTSSIASAAPVTAKSVNPMVTLSVLGSSSSNAAFCSAGGDAQGVCGVGAVNTAALAAVSAAQSDTYVEDRGANLVPLFIVLAGMVAAFFLLDDTILGDDDDDDVDFDVSPV